jgi:peptidoglycan/xylan/chitin deacetylase (PgdA/CDA1 family)
MPTANRYCVLNFHGIGTPKRQLDDGEELYWITADMFEQIMAAVAMSQTQNSVEITFDDGNKSDIEIALPILLRYQLTADFYVLAGRLDAPGSLTRDDIMQLQQSGMRIGSQGFDHVDWRKLDTNGRKREWEDARQAIAEITGIQIDSASIPFGSYNSMVIQALRELAYNRIGTSDRGLAKRNSPVIARTSVKSAMQIADIRKIMIDDYSTFVKAKRELGNIKRRLLG